MESDTLHVLLVDDELACREELRRYLAAFPYVTVIGEAFDIPSTIACLQQSPVELVFLDIELGRDNGFLLARHIHTSYPGCKIIFLTGHVDFALEGYEYGPVDFLVKPTNLLRLEQALFRVRQQREIISKEDVRIGIQSGNRLEIVNVQNVLYLEKRGRQVHLACENGEELVTRETLQKLENVFQPHGFYRCHQSFLVPLHRVRSVRLDDSKHTYYILLEGTQTPIPLSRDRFSELRQLLSQGGLKIF